MADKYNLKKLEKKEFWTPDECYWLLVGNWPELDSLQIAGWIYAGGGRGATQYKKVLKGSFQSQRYDIFLEVRGGQVGFCADILVFQFGF